MSWREVIYSASLVLALLAGIPRPVSGGANAVPSLSLEDIQDGIRMRAARLDRFSVNMQIRMYHRSDASGARTTGFFPEEDKIQRQGDRIRVLQREVFKAIAATVGTDWDRIRVLHPAFIYEFAWNGSRQTSLMTDPHLREARRYSGLIQARKNSAFRTSEFLTPIEQRVFDSDQPLSTLVTRGKWRLLGREAIDAATVWHIQGDSFGPSARTDVIDAWLDAVRDFAPLKITVTRVLHGITFRQALEHMELASTDGVWTPRRATAWVTNPDRLPGQSQVYEYSMEYHVGAEFPESLFTVQFPRGTLVWDDIAKVGSRVGSGEFVRGNDGLTEIAAANTRGAGLSPVAASGALAGGASVVKRLSWLNYLLAGATTIGLLAAAIWGARQLLRKGRS